MVLHEQNVLGLDVSVEDSVPVHVINRLKQLIHVVFDPVLGQIVAFALDCIIHIHVHEFEDECESSRRFIAKRKKCRLALLNKCFNLLEDFIELDDLRVRTEPTQRLDLSQIIDLLDCVEVVLHALDGDVLAGLDTLSLEHFREGSFTFLGY